VKEGRECGKETVGWSEEDRMAVGSDWMMKDIVGRGWEERE
jgi:hypothetical protein